MTDSSSNVQRYDALVRTERYFTATLLPAILFHDNLRGVEQFLDMVDERAKTERDKLGEPQPKAHPGYDFTNLQVITEFHIERDLTFAGMQLELVKGQKRDAPDVVIVAGKELIVCEGKFFSEFGRLDLNEQLLSQRRQVRHLFRHRPDLRAYRHVAILPAVLEGHVDADAVLTWADIGDLAENLLGAAHYVTQRLREAVKMYNQQLAANPGSGPNYEEMLPFDLMVRKCQQSGTEIWVGHDKGEANLRTWSAARIAGKKWFLAVWGGQQRRHAGSCRSSFPASR
jgi:hypothetical protein